jgi:hypothetical protein
VAKGHGTQPSRSVVCPPHRTPRYSNVSTPRTALCRARQVRTSEDRLGATYGRVDLPGDPTRIVVTFYKCSLTSASRQVCGAFGMASGEQVLSAPTYPVVTSARRLRYMSALQVRLGNFQSQDLGYEVRALIGLRALLVKTSVLTACERETSHSQVMQPRAVLPL